MKKINFKEGDWFGVPLKTGGYALGLIARHQKKSPACLGFFFGPKKITLPNIQQIFSRKPENAMLVAWFGNLGLIKGDWPIIGYLETFDKKDWPVPFFRRIDILDPNNGWRIDYEQENPVFGKPIREIPEDSSSLLGLPDEKLFGTRALEIFLAKLLQ